MTGIRETTEHRTYRRKATYRWRGKKFNVAKVSSYMRATWYDSESPSPGAAQGFEWWGPSRETLEAKAREMLGGMGLSAP